MIKQSSRRITHNDIFAVVNSVKPVPFDITRRHILFQYVTDSRFTPRAKLLATLKNLVTAFREKANLRGLHYEIGQVRRIDWPAPEPCLQYRIKIWVLKPRFYKEETG